MLHEIHPGVLFILGIGVFGGMLGAWLSQKVRFPQVVGYILIGLLIGESGLKLVRLEDVQALNPLNMFALGIIGFLVGGELHLDAFRKYARQFTGILLGEGLGAFLLVGGLSVGLLYIVCGNLYLATAAGLVFGAVASATDPASTIDVLWEYRARGVLTTSLTAIVALDDALAMFLYGAGTSLACLLTNRDGSVAEGMAGVAMDLGGSLLLGALFAGLLLLIIRVLYQPEKCLAISIGLILLLISIMTAWNMDVILASMTLGFIVANAAPRLSKRLFEMMRAFSIPIYVLFFVLVGARLGLAKMPGWMYALVVLYVLGRSIGKMAGAWYGAKITHGEAAVRKYLGMGLFAQGGVAVGLSIMAGQRLSGITLTPDFTLGDAIVFVVTATTLIVQLIGPPMVKLAIILAGESGRNITEEDIVSGWKVSDVIIRNQVNIPENMCVQEVIQLFVRHDFLAYPVVDAAGNLVGIITLNALKQVIADQDSWRWLIASDVMESTVETTFSNARLDDVMSRMRQQRITQLPVLESKEKNIPVGLLDLQHANKRIGDELILRRQPTS